MNGQLILLLKLKNHCEQTLQTELEECEQNSVNLNSLATVSKQLVSGDLLRSRDKRVRAVTACCLADILKLYAVDIPPYNDSELKVCSRTFFSFGFNNLLHNFIILFTGNI